jgi:hypothetical protein
MMTKEELALEVIEATANLVEACLNYSHGEGTLKKMRETERDFRSALDELVKEC